METKPLVQSWTFWFGIAQVASAVLGFFSGAMDQASALTLLVTGLGSIGLRVKTDTPVSGVF